MGDAVVRGLELLHLGIRSVLQQSVEMDDAVVRGLEPSFTTEMVAPAIC